MPEPRRVAVVGDAGHYVGPEVARHLAVRGYARLFILNTWLHDDTYDYTEGIRWWRSAATDPEQLGGDMPTGDIVAGSLRRPDLDAETIRAAFDAPFPDAASKAGAQRFPYCLRSRNRSWATPTSKPAPGDCSGRGTSRSTSPLVTPTGCSRGSGPSSGRRSSRAPRSTAFLRPATRPDGTPRR